jgi:hypothetical protein
MNDMFDNLKELKQHLKLESSKTTNKSMSAKTSIINTKSAVVANANETTADKEKRLQKEFKEFMKEASTENI